MSQVLVRSGRTAEALVQAQLAVNAAQDSAGEFESLERLAVAQSAAGKSADATATLARLESRAAILPGLEPSA